MKKLLLAGLAVGALAVGAPTASADNSTPHRYRGGCGYTTVNDTTPNQALGGNQSWNGEGSILVRSTDEAGTPTAESISASCDLYVDGVKQLDDYVTATGTGVATGAAKIQFSADEDDVVSACIEITIGGSWSHTHCDDGTSTPIVPEPVVNLINQGIDELNKVLLLVDPLLCAELAKHAGWHAGNTVYINGEGDVFLFGDTNEDHLWWDCPPYYVPPPA